MRNRIFKVLKGHTVAALVALMAAYGLFNGCVPPETTETVDVGVREKAIADSLRKVNYRKCQIALSTAFEYYKNKEFDRAVMNYIKMIDMDCADEFDDKLWIFLGNSFRELDKNDSALWAFDEGISRLPNDIGLRQNRAYIYTVEGQIDKQIAEWEKIVTIDSLNVDYWLKLHDIYFKHQDYENDLRILLKLIELDPDNIQVKNDQVTVMRMLGEDTTELLEARVENNPDNAEYLQEFADAIYSQQDYAKAVELYERLVIMDPEHGFALERIAACYKNLNENEKAIAALKKLLALRENDKTVLYDITEMYKNAGQVKTAYQWANRTIAAEPKDGRGYYIRALVLEEVVGICLGERGTSQPAYNDKLLYELALEDCRTASRMGYGPAEARIEFLVQLAPDKGDIFMHPEDKKPVGDCYSWLKRSVKR